MKERLKTISEEFNYLNEEKRKIESKTEKTIEDLENLAAIEELYKYMTERINNWANEKNKIDNNPQNIGVKEKSLRERFEENRDKIDVIRNKSKSMQPPFEGTDKKIKDQILEQLGFVKTNTPDGREVRIHPSLVGTYYDLVKEQKILTEQLNKEYYQTRDKREVTTKEEPSLTEVEDIFKQAFIEEEPKNITEQEIQNEEAKNIESKKEELERKKRNLELERDNILNNETGRKQFVKYKQKQYYIPRYYSGYFPVLLHEIEKIEEELNELKAKDNLSEERINIQEEKQVEKIMAEFFEGKQQNQEDSQEDSVNLESNSTENTLNESFKRNVLDKFEKAKNNQKEVENLSIEMPVISETSEYKTETEEIIDIFDKFFNSKDKEQTENILLDEYNLTNQYMPMYIKKYKDKLGEIYLETEFIKTGRKIKQIQRITEKGEIYYEYKNNTPIKYYKNEAEDSEEEKQRFDSGESNTITFGGETYRRLKDKSGNIYLISGCLECYNYYHHKKLVEKIDENGQIYYEGEEIEECYANEETLKMLNELNHEDKAIAHENDFEEDDFEEEYEDDFEEDDFEEEYEDDFDFEEDDFEEEYEDEDIDEKDKNRIPAFIKFDEKDQKNNENLEENEKIKNNPISKPLSGFVTKVRKSWSNIPKKAKLSAALVAASLIILISGIKISDKNKEYEDAINTTSTEEVKEDPIDEIDDKKENETNSIEDSKTDNIQIGDTIKIKEGARIYQNAYDSYLEINSYRPYYNFDDNRVILGTGILSNDKIEYVFACNENANQKINNLLNEGGEVVSILTGNKKYLSDYVGNDILTEDEINAYAEGWYNVEGINLNNMKGKSK